MNEGEAGYTLLDPHPAEVARRVVAEESALRDHLVVYLSGAHAYGFPSPDSDLDLKCIHIVPTRAMLGLEPPPSAHDRAGFVGGVEIDYTSNELAMALAGVLRGNGNFLERILCPARLAASPALAELEPLVRASLSRVAHKHYRGFAGSQRRELASKRSVKRLLYVLRTALTGVHLLRSGELVVDLPTLAGVYTDVVPELDALLARKREGERTSLDAAEVASWEPRLDALMQRLDDARDRSPLPESAEAGPIDAWLVALRASRL